MRHVPVGNQAAWVEAPGTAPGSERFITTPVYHHSHPCGWHPEYRREGVKKKEAGRGGALRVEPPAFFPRPREPRRGAELAVRCVSRTRCSTVRTFTCVFDAL